MKNLLVGNGVNIQFDNESYINKNIIIRLIKSLEDEDFPCDMIIDEPILLKWYLGKLFLFAREMIDGDADDVATCTVEKESLELFKERYKNEKNSLKITDIGYEDYYLVHDLLCHKCQTKNPEQYFIRESMRMSYLHAIYNNGKVNLLYKKYSENFINFLNKFNNIFSTNYDSNIELATGKIVYHIHGQFDKVSEVYNPESLRNQLNDRPIEGKKYDDKYSYLHSTALSTYCGDYKQYQINNNYRANSALEKMAKGYKSDDKIYREVEVWTNSDNILVSNLADAIKIKSQDPTIKFQEDYYIDEFTNIKGSISILGLSPYNDSHIFEIINNSDVEECIYYYFDSVECGIIESLLQDINKMNKLIFRDVRTFWEGM